MPGGRVSQGDTVTLRTVESEDIPFVQRAHTNPDLRVPLGWEVKTQTELEEELSDLFGHDEFFIVCLDEPEAGPGQPAGEQTRPIGCVCAATAEGFRTGIGYWIIPELHGEGYGNEAVSLFIDYIFRVHHHPTIYVNALPDNDASRGLLESLGFTQEGRKRNIAYWDGEYTDAISYSILREEWES